MKFASPRSTLVPFVSIELFQRGRIAGEEIRRRDRILEQRDDEFGTVACRRIELRVVDTVVERCAERYVRLQQATEDGTLGPRGIGEAAIPRHASQLGVAGENAGAFAEESCELT